VVDPNGEYTLYSLSRSVSEDEVDRILTERGIISVAKNSTTKSGPSQVFRPIQITGKPVSETIIEERR